MEDKNMVQDKIIELVKAFSMRGDYADINRETLLVQDLDFDSISIVQLLIEFETTFDIVIPDEELQIENFEMVGNLIDLVNRCIVGV